MRQVRKKIGERPRPRYRLAISGPDKGLSPEILLIASSATDSPKSLVHFCVAIHRLKMDKNSWAYIRNANLFKMSK